MISDFKTDATNLFISNSFVNLDFHKYNFDLQ